MKVELICVGSELLSGDVVNTNAAYISRKLRELGHESFRQCAVDDNKYRISELVKESLKRSDIIILTGGLGPTYDDLTKETVCEALEIELEENEICRRHLETYFRNAGKIPTENNFKQTLAPKDATIFINDIGTACGFGIEKNSKHIIMLPGPHKELVHMFDNYVVSYLKNFSRMAIVTHNVNVFGLGESVIAEKISKYCKKDNPIIATYYENNECRVSVTASAKTETEAEKLCSKAILDIKDVLGEFVYGCDSLGLANEVVNALRVSNLKISTAESCTGGMLSQALTSVPHSSESVEIGILAYSNRIKQEALSVPQEVLEQEGAISAKTAMYLAKNVRLLSGSDIGVSITGNAGPTASENKPIGLVYIGLADRTKYYIKKLTLPSTYDRDRIRNYSTLAALDLVRKYISARPFALPGMVGFDTDFVFEDETPQSVILENLAQNISDDATPKTTLESDINFVVFEQENNKTEEKKKKIINFNFASLFNKVFKKINNKTKDIIVKIIAIISVIGLIASSTALIIHFSYEHHQRSIVSAAREEFDFESLDKNADNNTFASFENLAKENPDIKAWIQISNTNINNPVYQTKDNDYYLNHNMLKKKSRYGALFFDYRNNISDNGNSKNLTIYGHNMKDKSMFANLLNFKKLNFYKENSIIELKSLYEQNKYVIFSVMITAGSSKDDNGALYQFYRSDFSSDSDFSRWIAEAKERSLINTSVEIGPEDEILTLSTCCYDFDNARFVVMAKKLKPNEQMPNADTAVYNPNPRYPQAWYDKKGIYGYKEDNGNLNNSSVNSESENESSSGTSSETACKHLGGYKYSNIKSATHTCICIQCNEKVEEPFHVFDQKVASKTFLKDGANCSYGNIYYKSCVCGKAGTETFESGNPNNNHKFGDWKKVKDATSSEPGLEERTCSICTTKETKEIPFVPSESSSDSSEGSDENQENNE
ncbi:MAG: competence/damage-inducible protein A [Ruminococcaceae bacterium]|nr:competence/damage-inducible protein A [Oscillospiraceae bacterium]